MARKKIEEQDEKELTFDDAKNIVKRLGNPERENKELELLKEAAVILLKEHEPDAEFEFDGDNDVDIGLASDSQTTSQLTKPPSFLEHAGSQIASLGTAGVMAIASATYFQVDTIVEQTREVAEVAEEKWEEFTFEHPNIGWHDPLASFTTIVGGVEPPQGINPKPAPSGEDENNDSVSKKKSESASKQIEEKPEKKSSKLPENEKGKEETLDDEKKESKTDDTIPKEQKDEEPTEESEAKEADGKNTGGESKTQQSSNSDTSESNGIKKKSKSGGLFDKLFSGKSKKEVIEDSEISDADQDVSNTSAETKSPPPEPFIDPEIDDIKPHSEVDIESTIAQSEIAGDQISLEIGSPQNIEQIMTPIDSTIASPEGPAKEVSPTN